MYWIAGKGATHALTTREETVNQPDILELICHQCGFPGQGTNESLHRDGWRMKVTRTRTARHYCPRHAEQLVKKELARRAKLREPE